MGQLDSLLPVCDAICIARGDLGNDMPLWELPEAQKMIAAACRAAGRYFMVATQMLSSMEKNAVPTRAELNDIFNTVMDGALMWSGIWLTLLSGQACTGSLRIIRRTGIAFRRTHEQVLEAGF